MSVQAVPDHIKKKDFCTFEIAQKNETNSDFYKQIQDLISNETYEGKYARYKLVKAC